MLENGGRILTAVVGAVALVAALIYAGHGIITRPVNRAIGPDTSIVEEAEAQGDGGSPGEEGSSGGAPGSEPGQAPGSAPGGETGPAGGGGGGGGAGSAPPEPKPYTETSIDIVTPSPVAVDVTLPQIAGGDPKITDTFNSRIRADLNDRITETAAGGRLTGSDGEVAHIGDNVISGVLLVTAEDDQSAVDLADTVVVAIDSGAVLTLDDLFTDTDAGLQQLAAASRTLGPSTDAGTSFNATAVTADAKLFSRWVATPDGMRIYFEEGAVAPSSYGLVELTVPWDELGDVLDPDMSAVVTS